MPITNAMWIHGNTVQLENQWPNMTVVRTASSAKITVIGVNLQIDKNYFHFGVPTPVIVNDKRLRLTSVLVRFRTANCKVKSINVFDGDEKIHGKVVNMNPGFNWFTGRLDLPQQPEIKWGVGITIEVEWGADETKTRFIEFSSAGADFI